MCATCGCADPAGTRLIEFTNEHEEGHGHGHGHRHDHGHSHEVVLAESDRTVLLEQRVLARNDELAASNRNWLAKQEILTINLMSSPGSGKTTLLERTIRELAETQQVSVIEGDQETAMDAQRIRAAGCAVVQINTGAGCHLDAAMLSSALDTLKPPAHSLLFIENVGNLVCPALFDLGESCRAVIMSVTEGADKPLKYPHMFRTADLVLLNKIDLLPYVDFQVPLFHQQLARVANQSEVIQVCATTGAGLPSWYDWLRRNAATANRPMAHDGH